VAVPADGASATLLAEPLDATVLADAAALALLAEVLVAAMLADATSAALLAVLLRAFVWANFRFRSRQASLPVSGWAWGVVGGAHVLSPLQLGQDFVFPDFNVEVLELQIVRHLLDILR
jgi:hypothetical protein